MTPGVRLGPVSVFAALALALAVLAGPALAQNQTVTRGDQAPAKSTTTSAPPRTTQTSPSRTMPSTMPVDPGGLGGLPSSGAPRTGPDYGPTGPGGTRTVRPRRSTAPPPDAGSGGDIPYVDPPAAPGYESASDAPMRTAGGRPATQTDSPAAPAKSAAATPASPKPSDGDTIVVVTANPAAPPTAPAAGDPVIADTPAPPPPLDPNLLWIALAGLAAMLVAAGLGLRHILTAPHLGFRVTVDHGVQSAPRFKGAAS